jgi:hypothetical protein
MSTVDLNPVRLAAVRTEQEAAMIVAELERHDIEARMVGETVSSFRAEVPGTVSVLVRRSDYDRALRIIRDVSQTPFDPPDDEESPWNVSFFRRICLFLVMIYLVVVAAQFLYSILSLYLAP